MPAFSPALHIFGGAHYFQASYTHGLALGWALFAVFYFLREPFCELLLSPHREALLPLARKKISLTPLRTAGISVSLILGQWTHLLWDSFTHERGYFVQAFPAYARAFVRIFGYSVPASYICQVASTAAGLVILCICYRSWLKKQERPILCATIETEGWRCAFWMAALAVPLPFAISFGMNFVRYIRGYNLVRLFLITGTMRYLSIFLPVLFFSCVISCIVMRFAGARQRRETKAELESA
jgi:hypothetical protein